MEPGRFELYPYLALMETSDETDAGPALVLSRNQDVALHDTYPEVKGQLDLRWCRSGSRIISHKDVMSLTSGQLPYPPAPPSLPPLLPWLISSSIPRGG